MGTTQSAEWSNPTNGTWVNDRPMAIAAISFQSAFVVLTTLDLCLVCFSNRGHDWCLRKGLHLFRFITFVIGFSLLIAYFQTGDVGSKSYVSMPCGDVELKPCNMSSRVALMGAMLHIFAVLTCCLCCVETGDYADYTSGRGDKWTLRGELEVIEKLPEEYGSMIEAFSLNNKKKKGRGKKSARVASVGKEAWNAELERQTKYENATDRALVEKLKDTAIEYRKKNPSNADDADSSDDRLSDDENPSTRDKKDDDRKRRSGNWSDGCAVQ